MIRLGVQRLSRGALLTGILVLSGCGSDKGTTGPAVTIGLSPTSVDLFVGETATLTATVTGTSQSAQFTSSATNVATVSSTGLVTAVGIGTATITATVGGETAQAQVTVNESSIALDATDVEIYAGESRQLTATITGGVGLTTSWSSSDDGVATVDDSGLVHGVAAGEAEVTAAVDGQPGVEATATVTVLEPEPMVAFQGLTQDGEAVDPEAAAGLLQADLTVELAGFAEGTVEILFDDVVVAQTQVDAPTAAAGQGSDGPARAPQTVSVPVNTAGYELDGERPVPLLLNGRAYAVTATLQIADQPVTEASLGMVTLANDPVLVVTQLEIVPPEGGGAPLKLAADAPAELASGDIQGRVDVLTFDGQPVGDVAVTLELVEQVEAAVHAEGVATSELAKKVIITATALQGYFYFTLLRSVSYLSGGAGGLDGLFAFGAATVALGGGSAIPIVVANTLPLLYVGLVASLLIDNAGPAIAALLTTAVWNGWIGAWATIPAQMSKVLGLRWAADENGDPTITDRSGSVSCQFDFGTVLGVWTYLAVLNALDLPETVQREIYMRLVCYDLFGNRAEVILRNSDGDVDVVGIDVTPPKLTFVKEDGLIADRAVNPVAGSAVRWLLTDEGSGPVVDRFRIAMFYATALGVSPEACLIGLYVEALCTAVELQIAQSVGLIPESSETGEYHVSVQGVDRAGNSSRLRTLKFIHDVVAPTIVGNLILGELLGGDGDVSGVTISDNLRVKSVKLALAFGAYSLQFKLFRALLARGHDADWVTSYALAASVFFIPSIEFVAATFPFTPQGLASRVVATALTLSGVGAGGGIAQVAATIALAQLALRATSFGANGMDSFGWGLVTPILCKLPEHSHNGESADCGSTPTEGQLSVDAYIPGSVASGPPNEIVHVQLYRVVEIDGVQFAVPVGDRITGTVQDFTTYRIITYLATINASLVGLPLGLNQFFALAFDEHGNALMSPYCQVNVVAPE